MTGDAPGTGPEHAPAPRPPSVRPLAAVLTAMAVSLTGTRVSAVALPWFVLVTTGSATRTGLVAFCEMAPYVAAKALAGPLVDRIGPRPVSWTTDLASAAAAAAVPVLHALGLLSFPLLLALVAVVGAARGPADSAKEVMVPDAAERAGVPLERATGLSGVTERLASTLGPAVGGGLVALLGPVAGLAVNAACFALGSAVVALALPPAMGRAYEDHPHQDHRHDDAAEHGGEPPGQSRQSRQPGRPGPPGPPGEPGYWRQFGEGLAFLRGEPLLLTVIVMLAVTNLLDMAFSAVLLPVWAKESGHGPTAIGLTGTVMGAAAVAGSLVAAAAAHRLRRRTVFFGGFLLAGAPRFLVLAADAPMGAVLGVFAVAGFGAGFLNPVLAAVLFERVPRPLLGRVNALGDALSWAGMPLGGLVAGAAVASAGLVPALVAGGAAYFAVTSLAGLRPEWREMDRTRGHGAADRPHPGAARRAADLGSP